MIEMFTIKYILVKFRDTELSKTSLKTGHFIKSLTKVLVTISTENETNI